VDPVRSEVLVQQLRVRRLAGERDRRPRDIRVRPDRIISAATSLLLLPVATNAATVRSCSVSTSAAVPRGAGRPALSSRSQRAT
jgi:hypothetical protein